MRSEPESEVTGAGPGMSAPISGHEDVGDRANAASEEPSVARRAPADACELVPEREPLPDAEAIAAPGTTTPSASTFAPESPEPAIEEATPPPALPPIIDVDWLDWDAVRAAVAPAAIRARLRDTVMRMEELLDRSGGPGLLFDADRADPTDRAIRINALDEDETLWFIGDLHGDLLALEAALALIRASGGGRARLVFLGDLFDDGGHGLEVLARVAELIVDDPGSVCLVAGNHDVALTFDGARFSATVSPSDFADYLNGELAHEWVVRMGKIAVRAFADAPRALFFPDGLLVAHGGFPLVDLHAALLEHGDWNDPACLSDFVWTRAHPRARRKMPNRASRGSQFGHEDFAAFCELATTLGRPVTHMVRGHDHVDERWAVYPAYAAHPVLTTVALSRQLARESFGPYERVPTVARWMPGALPQVHRLLIPGALVREIFPETADAEGVPE